MKRRMLLVAILVMMLTLCGCGAGTREVPEFELEYYVQNYNSEHLLEGYISQEIEAVHDWDGKNRLDKVQVKVITEYRFGYVTAESECVFQYDKSSERWILRSGSNWIEKIEYDTKKLQYTAIEGEYLSFFPCNYYLYFFDIDWDANLIDCEYGFSGRTETRQINTMKGFTLAKLRDGGMADITTVEGGTREMPCYGLSIIQEDICVNVFFSITGVISAYMNDYE